MEYEKAHSLAISLMEQHGLIAQGWRFKYNRGKKMLGLCQIKRKRVGMNIIEDKTIQLSIHLVRLNDEAEVRETILHEIAHALAGLDNGHNWYWKTVCMKIGAKPYRTSSTAKTVKPKYQIVCNSCNNVLRQMHRRRNQSVLHRRYCRSCGPSTLGKLIIKEN